MRNNVVELGYEAAVHRMIKLGERQRHLEMLMRTEQAVAALEEILDIPRRSKRRDLLAVLFVSIMLWSLVLHFVMWVIR